MKDREEWKTSEERALVIMQSLGVHYLALVMERSEESIKQHAKVMRKRGIAISLLPREAKIDDTLLTPEYAARLAKVADSPICPSCGEHRVGVRISGLCGKCHFELLTGSTEDKIAAIKAEMEYEAAKSKLKRLRDKHAAELPDRLKADPRYSHR